MKLFAEQYKLNEWNCRIGETGIAIIRESPHLEPRQCRDAAISIRQELRRAIGVDRRRRDVP